MIVIIGAGIAGLYLGYLLKKLKKEFIIIEKDNRYGGRVYVDDFCGKSVILGAGIGRFNKDITLFNFCKKLGVEVNKYKKKIDYSFKVTKTLLTYVEELKKINISSEKRSKTTFLEFLRENCKNANKFTTLSGYTDYINADIVDTLYDYGFDDNTDEVNSYNFTVDWNGLLDSLYSILKRNIKLEEKILRVDTNSCIVFTDKGQYNYSKVVCSTPVTIAREIFSDNKNIVNILRELDCQTFSRIYTKISDGNNILSDRIDTFTIVDSFLQKIIPIDKEKGIYMIGYNDNYCADRGFEYFMTLDEECVYKILENEIEKIFDVKVKVEFSKIVYWEYGTTYYLPLSKKYKNREEWLVYAQNPLKNVFFIGEGFSHNQGWVEGSLESVDSIINLI